jgi:CRP-like cAMP-binding protein
MIAFRPMFSKNAKVERLKRVPLFAHCSRGELERIALVADELTFPAGRTLIREGDVGRELLVLLDGEVEVRRNGRRLPPRGDVTFFGEIALLTGVRRTATVTTTSPVDALVLTARAFERLLDESREIRQKVLASLAERLGDEGVET